VSALTLRELVDILVAARRAGGFRSDGQARVLARFAGHCRREGYADGSIIQEAVEGFLSGRHLKASTIRREEIVLRDLAEHARQFGWPAWAPPTLTRVKARHRPPAYGFSDQEISPPLRGDRHAAALRGVQPGAGRPGAVPPPLRHRAAHLRSAEPATP
jgi:integrase/recombinase XerD